MNRYCEQKETGWEFCETGERLRNEIRDQAGLDAFNDHVAVCKEEYIAWAEAEWKAQREFEMDMRMEMR